LIKVPAHQGIGREARRLFDDMFDADQIEDRKTAPRLDVEQQVYIALRLVVTARASRTGPCA
jgi:hypothetical protein